MKLSIHAILPTPITIVVAVGSRITETPTIDAAKIIKEKTTPVFTNVSSCRLKKLSFFVNPDVCSFLFLISGTGNGYWA